jgi:hypothetical protein
MLTIEWYQVPDVAAMFSEKDPPELYTVKFDVVLNPRKTPPADTVVRLMMFPVSPEGLKRHSMVRPVVFNPLNTGAPEV